MPEYAMKYKFIYPAAAIITGVLIVIIVGRIMTSNAPEVGDREHSALLFAEAYYLSELNKPDRLDSCEYSYGRYQHESYISIGPLLDCTRETVTIKRSINKDPYQYYEIYIDDGTKMYKTIVILDKRISQFSMDEFTEATIVPLNEP